MPQQANTDITVGIVAGEMSGDQLGAGLIRALKSRWPDARFIGIGGPAMMDAGCDSLFPIDRLSVMDIFAVLGRLRELLNIRKTLKRCFLEQKIDVFIGIDSPDFNLPLEGFLKQRGIKTVHYVSPTVWAWRQKRVFKIRRDVDLMLTLLPFEADFYRRFDVPVRFVGHPFATDIDPDIDHERAKRFWDFAPVDKVVAVMPGSRGGELKYMGPLFLETMRLVYIMCPQVRFIVPLASAQRRQQFEQQMSQYDVDLPVQMVDGHAREAMAAADYVLATSGTVTLEAMLLKRPMVVAFRWGAITHAILSPLVKNKYIALPNLLADEEIAPEFLQEKATPEALARELYSLMQNKERCRTMQARFDDIHHQLNLNASTQAAAAVAELLEENVGGWRAGAGSPG
ncbi:MAG TPA: lipid-A-disaccharide synthase [Gammaproteobacteria bacterium]|nr:lipid-A-disaccharide synthase [Gammaproteobacteria bacterium]